MDPISVTGAALAVGLTQLFKPYVPKQFWPLLAFLIALLWAIALAPPMTVAAFAGNVQQALLMTAGGSGAYAIAKHVATTPLSSGSTEAK
ncbi:MAG: hypothetical protein KGL39_12010 [Patescibacteria group bacterium]|nr:hypothetical protein [Patescibacteria group bacterium]